MTNTNQLPEYVTRMYTGTQTQGSQQDKKTAKDYINKMYDSTLEAEKATLEQNYNQAEADLEEQQRKAQKQTDANLNRTYVEAAKAQKNWGEVQNAYGLTSGAMAQARLSQDNQLQGDLTALRAVQQEVDASVEREKSLLAKEYAAAIQQAQANNDIERAQALYEEAQAQDARLLQQQEEAAERQRQKEEEAAYLMAEAGDFSLIAQLYGLTPEQLAKLQGETESAGANFAGGTGNGGLYPTTEANAELEQLRALYEAAIAALEAERAKNKSNSSTLIDGGVGRGGKGFSAIAFG